MDRGGAAGLRVNNLPESAGEVFARFVSCNFSIVCHSMRCRFSICILKIHQPVHSCRGNSRWMKLNKAETY